MSDKPSPPLVKDDKVVDTHVYVGTNVWFDHWLADPKLESFRYECPEGSFTARQRKGGYWNAYRKVKGKLRQEYLGKATDLTQTKLIETARTLAMDNTEYWRMKYPSLDQAPQPSQESTGLYNQSVDCITETDSKETTNAVRQWCVFARHNDGMLQFMGTAKTKGDAEYQARRLQQEHHRLESIGDKPYIGPPPVYEVREMLVAPVDLYANFDKQAPDLQGKVTELEAKLVVLKNSVEPLKCENERLREQIRDYREKLTASTGLYNQSQSCITETQEEVRRLQAVVALEKQQKEICQQKLDKAQQSNKELASLVREARAELEQLQSSTRSPDPGDILQQLRGKLSRKSKATLQDVEVILELLGAIAL